MNDADTVQDMLSRQQVIAAYQFLLGRAPENEDVIAHHQGHPSVASLRQEILISAEFESLYRNLDAGFEPSGDTFPPLSQIDTHATGWMQDAMWARVAASWHQLGQDAPHCSVLTFDKFRPEFLDDNHEEFLETAAIDMKVVDAALERLPFADRLRAGSCLEIGCGVGRATRGLAQRFGHVLGVDVSAPHLDIATAELTGAGCDNVTLRRINGIGEYADLGSHDFFYSRIVLQHNPPPVQVAILTEVLRALASPGAALFQVVTHIPDYSFSVDAYMQAAHTGMEMHALPQQALFGIIREAGLSVIEIHRDDSTAGATHLWSHMILAAKTPDT